MLRTPPAEKPTRRLTTKPAAKRKWATGVAAKRERLKPVSLWPLTFDQALDALLAAHPKAGRKAPT